MTRYSTPALRITAKVEGFRRAGMAHPARATDHPAGTFSPRQVEELMGDAGLVVQSLGFEADDLIEDRRPRDAVAVLAAIAASFAELKPTDLGNDGRPMVKAVERVLGYDVTEAEVDYAWQRAQAAKEQPAPEPAPEKPSPSPEGDSGAGSAGKGKGKTKS